MPIEPDTVDTIEAAQNITLMVAGTEVPIAELDTEKEITMEQIRQNSLKANGVSVTAIEYSGSASFKGDRVSGPDGRARLDDMIYDDKGVPVAVEIVIEHIDGETDEFLDVFFVSDGYNSESESESETSYDWIAMRKADEQ